MTKPGALLRAFSRRWLVLICASVSLIACASASQAGDTKTDNMTVDLGGAEAVRAEIKMGAGELNLTSGREKLLDASFSYNVPSLKPAVEYSVSGKQGKLTVSQPSASGAAGNVVYRWDLKLRYDVPIDLVVQLGAGTANLKLGGMTLTTARVQRGAGDLTVDLSGAWARTVETHLIGGAGKTTVIVPRLTGARVDTKASIGKVDAPGLKKDGNFYVNDLYGKGTVSVQVIVESGAGDIALVLGNQ